MRILIVREVSAVIQLTRKRIKGEVMLDNFLFNGLSMLTLILLWNAVGSKTFNQVFRSKIGKR